MLKQAVVDSYSEPESDSSTRLDDQISFCKEELVRLDSRFVELSAEFETSLKEEAVSIKREFKSLAFRLNVLEQTRLTLEIKSLKERLIQAENKISTMESLSNRIEKLENQVRFEKDVLSVLRIAIRQLGYLQDFFASLAITVAEGIIWLLDQVSMLFLELSQALVQKFLDIWMPISELCSWASSTWVFYIAISFIVILCVPAWIIMIDFFQWLL